jgi:hypothetical protein
MTALVSSSVLGDMSTGHHNQCIIEASVALFRHQAETTYGKDHLSARNVRFGEQKESAVVDLSFLDSDSDTFYDALGPATSSKISMSVSEMTQLLSNSRVLHARFFFGGGLR